MKAHGTRHRGMAGLCVAFLLFGFVHAGAQPVSGDWKAVVDFGEFTFTVDPDAEAIDMLQVSVNQFSCGEMSVNNSVRVEANPAWPIANRGFSMSTNIDPLGCVHLVISGTFDIRDDRASGVWMLTVFGTICSGPWMCFPVSADDGMGAVRDESILRGILPNPLRGSTEIVVSPRKAEAVTLTVHDILGRLVGTLHDGMLPAGEQHIRWDASGLPAGLYLCRLQAGASVEVRKLVIVR